MSLRINRETIKAFILNELTEEKMSLVSNAILSDKRLARIYEEEKLKIDTKRYYDNMMTPAQRLEYESRLIKDMEAFTKVDQPKETSGSSDELLLKNQLEEAFRNYEASQEQPRTNTPSITIIKKTSISDRFKYWFAAASILVLLIVGITIGYNVQPSDSLENRLYAEYHAPLNYKNIYLLDKSPMGVVKQRYMEGDYTSALTLLNSLPSSEVNESEKNLFTGLNMMEIGKYRVAAGYLEEILASQRKLEYTSLVRWYLGLCYLKIGDRRKAIDTFRAIMDSDDYNYTQANQILKKLSD